MMFAFNISDTVQLAAIPVIGGIVMAIMNQMFKRSDRKADAREELRAEILKEESRERERRDAERAELLKEEQEKRQAREEEVARLAAKDAVEVKKVAATAATAATEVKEEVKQVAATLEKNTEETSKQLTHLTKVAHDTHVLVNNNMAIQLRLNAGNAREVADLTVGTPQHAKKVQLAEEAENLLADHLANQAAVDSQDPAKAEADKS